jgi:LPXTG-motif cell wall-anchored protein
MSVNPASRRRKLARTISAAGLATALSGSALVVGAILPTASAAVDPVTEDGTIVGGGFPRDACAMHGFDGDYWKYSNGNGSNGGADFEVTIEDNLLDVTVLNADANVTAVFVTGIGASYNKFVGTPYLEGDDLLGMYAPGSPSVAEAAIKGDAELHYDKGSDNPKINHWLICGEEKPDETPTPTPTPTPTDTPEPEPELVIVEPICDDDVPYLEYIVDPQGTDVSEVTITWINPTGDDVVYENLPLAARVLWAGAVTDEDGVGIDWPGWIQLEDGSWIQGDDGFEWVRPSVDILFEVNPEFTVTVDYPPSEPECDANPPQAVPPADELPETGGNANLAIAGGGLLLGGLALLLFGRRKVASES